MLKPTVLLVFLTVLVGCTNVTGDAPRGIFLLSGERLGFDRIFSIANTFFSAADYECSTDAEASLFRCSKEIRDLYIHQTRSVVRIYGGDGEDETLRVAATRWDEGLIPSEFISNRYSNKDVEAFCAYLATEKVAVCNRGKSLDADSSLQNNQS